MDLTLNDLLIALAVGLFVLGSYLAGVYMALTYLTYAED